MSHPGKPVKDKGEDMQDRQTHDLVSDWIGVDSEWIGIIADLINGTYTVDDLRADFTDFIRYYNIFWDDKTGSYFQTCPECERVLDKDASKCPTCSASDYQDEPERGE